MSHITPQRMGQHYLGPFWPSPGTHLGPERSKNGYFGAQNQATMADWFQGGESYLESALCAISPPNAWKNMTKDHFCPLQAPIQGLWSKNGYFRAQNQASMADWFQGRESYLETALCAISPPNVWKNMTEDHFCPIQGLQWSKNGYFGGPNQAYMAGCFQGGESYLETALWAISPPNAWKNMTPTLL